ncbi:MAG: Holliday junction helicase RuvA [Chloroflexi bacterium]|nr:Holliday junction helicase RuvA [Chloroflexota bacterium]
MIAGIRGRVLRSEPGSVVVSVGPVDVRVLVPVSLTASLAPGQEVSLRTHLHVREDRLELYGFNSDAALEAFTLLTSVSGVGPKLALGVLGSLDPRELAQAIARGDTHTLSRAPGVGARAATRIVTELQSKIGADWGEAPGGGELLGSAVAALVAMGYSTAEAREAVGAVSPGDSMEDTLRAALSALAGR